MTCLAGRYLSPFHSPGSAPHIMCGSHPSYNEPKATRTTRSIRSLAHIVNTSPQRRNSAQNLRDSLRSRAFSSRGRPSFGAYSVRPLGRGEIAASFRSKTAANSAMLATARCYSNEASGALLAAEESMEFRPDFL